VLGTKFNIKEQGDSTVVLTVAEGAVNFSTGESEGVCCCEGESRRQYLTDKRSSKVRIMIRHLLPGERGTIRSLKKKKTTLKFFCPTITPGERTGSINPSLKEA
jgi:hypothetical protein